VVQSVFIICKHYISVILWIQNGLSCHDGGCMTFIFCGTQKPEDIMKNALVSQWASKKHFDFHF